MNHIGLFEGIGGFSLAARWMGWETIAWCEWNEFCQKVLKHHFPNAKEHGDITKTDFNVYRGQCDIVTGGFPCQPYSAAGKRLGKLDDRHLWPEMCRAIREIQPRWVVGENVHGLLNWNGGLVLDEIKADLEAAGFEVFPPFVLPACGVNAPHRRDRVWIVAYSKYQRRNDRRNNEGWGNDNNDGRIATAKCDRSKRRLQLDNFTNGSIGPASNPDSNGHELRGHGENRFKEGESESKQDKRERVRGNVGGIGEQEFTSDTNSSIGRKICGHEGSKGGISSEHPVDCDYGCNGFTPNPGSQQFRDLAQNNIGEDRKETGPGMDDRIERPGDAGDAANAHSQRRCSGNVGREDAIHANPCSKENGHRGIFERFPTQSPLCSRNDGLSGGLAGITFSKHRNESIKGYGNSIVPQVALQIYKAIEEFESLN